MRTAKQSDDALKSRLANARRSNCIRDDQLRDVVRMLDSGASKLAICIVYSCSYGELKSAKARYKELSIK